MQFKEFSFAKWRRYGGKYSTRNVRGWREALVSTGLAWCAMMTLVVDLIDMMATISKELDKLTTVTNATRA